MYETQLLKIRIRPGMTDKVVEFIRSLQDREGAALEAMRREGMLVETLFLERREEADYLYYYVKSKDLAAAYDVNMRSNDPLTQEIRQFISETWGEIASPEPLLDLNLIPEAPRKPRAPAKPVRLPESKSAPVAATPHVLAGG